MTKKLFSETLCVLPHLSNQKAAERSAKVDTYLDDLCPGQALDIVLMVAMVKAKAAGCDRLRFLRYVQQAVGVFGDQIWGPEARVAVEEKVEKPS